jgi:predicted Fe-Mo cluster-binding NifX family protein
MKVAVSSTGKDLDSPIDPRFGRCAYFVLVDTEGMGFEALENEAMGLSGGAGIQAAQLVASRGAKTVITGHCGPNAVRTLNAAGLHVIVDQSGTVREAVEDYKAGKLKNTTEPNVSDHFGMGGGGRGRGGGGRGMGGGGRGMGGGGRGMGGCGRGMGGGRGRGGGR